MARIFICYRREDASGHAGRLRDLLSAEFGAAEIFRDIDAIGPGDDFVRMMSGAIASCAVFLAVIGRHWLTAAAGDGSRRLDDPDDHVRGEIAEALKRGVRVIPVLVQDARMPSARELPEPLKGLAARNAIALDDEGWESDVQRLAAAIRQELHDRAVGGVETLLLFAPVPASPPGTRSPLAAPLPCSRSLCGSLASERNKARPQCRHPRQLQPARVGTSQHPSRPLRRLPVRRRQSRCLQVARPNWVTGCLKSSTRASSTVAASPA